MLKKLTFRLERILKFEYWPFWVFYTPVTLIWIWFSLRMRTVVYFSAANPRFFLGGLMLYDKYKAIAHIDSKYLPKVKFYNIPQTEGFHESDFKFPLIFKPNIGERGKDVELIWNSKQLHHMVDKSEENFMLQDYIDYPLEFGVLYYRYPSGKSGITSIVGKQFLYVEGDGISTLKNLILKNIRAENRLDYFKEKFGSRFNEVLPKDAKLLLEEIGNHCRGTTFTNENHLITDQLVSVFDSISESIPDFYYGRFDLKVPSLEDFYKGENIKIFELNGVNSEPAHIYEPGYGLLNAYKDVYENQRIVYEISKENIKKHDIKPNTLIQFLKALKAHFIDQ